MVRHKNRKRKIMEPDTIMDDLAKELNIALKAMAKAKDVNEKEIHSRIVKNLCESMGVFLNLASEMMPFEDDDV
jgi:DNA-binding Xre family transcriptional regulator